MSDKSNAMEPNILRERERERETTLTCKVYLYFQAGAGDLEGANLHNILQVKQVREQGGGPGEGSRKQHALRGLKKKRHRNYKEQLQKYT